MLAYGALSQSLFGVASSGEAGSGRGLDHSAGSHSARHRRPAGRRASAIERIIVGPLLRVVSFIPTSLWVALAGLTLLSIVLATSVLALSRSSRHARRLAADAARAAATDALTGLLNRRGFEQALATELARSQRYGHPLTVAYLDVEGLKRINDSQGHRAGDEILCAVASVIRGQSRGADLSARLGGDEYAVALVEQDGAQAERFRERLGTEVRAAGHRLGYASRWGVTVGMASFPEDGASVDGLLSEADRRLYAQRGIALPDQSRASSRRAASLRAAGSPTPAR